MDSAIEPVAPAGNPDPTSRQYAEAVLALAKQMIEIGFTPDQLVRLTGADFAPVLRALRNSVQSAQEEKR